MANDTQFIDPFPDEEVIPSNTLSGNPPVNTVEASSDFVDPFPDEVPTEITANDEFDPLAPSYEMPTDQPVTDAEKGLLGNTIDYTQKQTANIFGGLLKIGEKLLSAADIAQMVMDKSLGIETGGRIGLSKKDGYKYYSTDDLIEAKKNDEIYSPLKAASKYWKDYDTGYVPDHTSEKFKEVLAKGDYWETTKEGLKFAVENGVGSLPYMALAVINMPLSVAALSDNIADERALNKGKKDYNLIDLYESAPFALASTILDRIMPKSVLANLSKANIKEIGKKAIEYGYKQALKRIAVEGGKDLTKEAFTEFLQEGVVEYIGGTYGTDKEMSVAEGAERGAFGALAGGPTGGVIGAGAQAYKEAFRDGSKTESNDISADELGDIPEDSTPTADVNGGDGLVGPVIKRENGVDFDTSYQGLTGPIKKESFQENEQGIDFQDKESAPTELGLVEQSSAQPEVEQDNSIDFNRIDLLNKSNLTAETTLDADKRVAQDGRIAEQEEQLKGVTLPEGFEDNRLKRLEFRDRAKLALDEMVKGGGISLIPDPNFVQGESDKRGETPLIRTKSQNPEWVQAILADTGMSVEKVKEAVDKALRGEKLGIRQGAAVQGVLDYVSDQRTGDEYGNLDYAKQQLEKARQLRQEFAQGTLTESANDWVYEETYYSEDADSAGRIIYEMLQESQAFGEEAENDAMMVLERGLSDEATMQQLSQLIREYNGYDQQEYEQISSGDSAQAPPNAEREGNYTEAPQPDAGGLNEPNRQQLGLAEPQQIEPSTEGFFDPNEENFAPEVAQEEITSLDDMGDIAEQALTGPNKENKSIQGKKESEEITPISVDKEKSSKTKGIPAAALNNQDARRSNPERANRTKKGERRTHANARELYSKLSREELLDKLLSHELTGVKGRRSFVVEIENAENVFSIDADSLKWFNDNMSPESGDKLLQEIADALIEKIGYDNVYHISGDEFYVLDAGESIESVENKINEVQKQLESSIIKLKKDDATEITKTGVSFTYGAGKTKTEADSNLKRDKNAKESRGERAARGEEPEGVKRTGVVQPVDEGADDRNSSKQPLPDTKRAGENDSSKLKGVPKAALKKNNKAEKSKKISEAYEAFKDLVEKDKNIDIAAETQIKFEHAIDESNTEHKAKAQNFNLTNEDMAQQNRWDMLHQGEPLSSKKQKAYKELTDWGRDREYPNFDKLLKEAGGTKKGAKAYESFTIKHIDKYNIHHEFIDHLKRFRYGVDPQETIPKAALKAKPEATTKKAEKTYGKKNKVFTEDAAEKARAILKSKLNSTFNSGIDPEIVQAGITLAGYHIEAGARKFTDFSKAMIDDLGANVKPYLRSWYEGVRYYPSFDNDGMTHADNIPNETIPKKKPTVKIGDVNNQGLLSRVYSLEEREELPLSGEQIEHIEKLIAESIPDTPKTDKALQQVAKDLRFKKPKTYITTKIVPLVGPKKLNQSEKDALKYWPEVNDVWSIDIELEVQNSEWSRFYLKATPWIGSAPLNPQSIKKYKNTGDDMWFGWNGTTFGVYDRETGERVKEDRDLSHSIQRLRRLIKEEIGVEVSDRLKGVPAAALKLKPIKIKTAEQLKTSIDKDEATLESGRRSNRELTEKEIENLEGKIEENEAALYIAENLAPLKEFKEDLAQSISTWSGQYHLNDGDIKDWTESFTTGYLAGYYGTGEFPQVDSEFHAKDQAYESGRIHGSNYEAEERKSKELKGVPKAALKEAHQPDMFADSSEKATLSTEDKKNASISNNDKKPDPRTQSDDGKQRAGSRVGGVSGTDSNSQNRSGKTGKTESRSKQSAGRDGNNEHGGNERTGNRSVSNNGRSEPSVRTNYRITEADTLGKRTPIQKAQDNIAAIRTLKTILSENRGATAAEQKELIKYVGWGSSDIANKLFPSKAKPTGTWEELHDELREVLTEEELKTAARSTQYAHYTSKTIIDSIYTAIKGFGLENGLAIEGGAGTGNFIGLIPDGINLHYAAIEMDTISAGIAKSLYPESGLIAGDFTKIHLPQNHYDLSIGNPPFANFTVKNDARYKANKFLLHDYFIAKQIDSVKAGGISVFVTSKGTMDKADSAAREYLNSKADLIGAIRLPQTAFKENAGTEVVTDILFFKKRAEGVDPSGKNWMETREISVTGGTASINEYFATHPKMILGESALTSGQFGETYTVTPTGDLDVQLNKAIKFLPKGIYSSNLSSSEMDAKIKEFSLNPKDKESSYYLDNDNVLRIVQDGVGAVVPIRGGEQRTGLSKKKAEIARDYIPLRDAVMDVYREQLIDGNWKEAQKKLHKAYDTFTNKHGAINQSKTTVRKDGVEIVTEPIISVIDVDPEAYRIAGIESYDDATGKGSKGIIFSENVISRLKESSIETATDALNVTLNDRGYVDLEYLAEKYGQPTEDILDELGVAVFKDPSSGRYVTEDDYLSGNVKDKLTQAKEAGNKYSKNVKALEAVQPEDLPMSRVPVNLGALWIDSDIIEKFAKEVMGLNGTVRSFIKAENSSWSVEGVTDSQKYATSRLTSPKILEAALNKRTIRVYDTFISDGKEIRELNKIETAAGNQKAQDLKDEFVRWGLSDVESAEKMHEKYNRVFNTVVPRKYNGEHLSLPRLSSRYKLHQWQRDVVWRILQRGNTYMAHTVGAGKTLASNVAGMELRRLGLAKKPTYVVLKSTLKQFATELLDAYPDAKILVADEKQLDKKNRRRFLARIANEDWDAIILTHQSFEKISLSEEFITEQINKDISEFREILEEVEEDERATRKTIERQIESLEKRLEGQTAQDKKDAGLTFEELGIDFLFVDEAHTHKKVPFPTAQSNLKGVDSSGSGIAYDLYLKSKYLNTIKPNRNMVLMSGTPVTNTLGEVFNIQRYLQPEVLERNQISSFDAWTATFADTVTELEMQASGSFKPVTRLAKFVGVPALLRDFLMVADIVSDDTLKESVTMKRPSVKGGRRELIAVPRTKEMKEFQEDLKDRISKLEERKGPPKKGDDNILVVITDARKASIDMRLVGRKQTEKSKLDVLIDDVYERWASEKDTVYYKGSKEEPVTGATQLIFTELRRAAGFDIYEHIRNELISRGIPKSEIAFIQEATNSNKKKKFFRDMNTGVKRIMIGGSKNMGTGVNVQQRLQDIHHLDIDYLPANIIQREGRGVRQGNKNAEIGLYAYATEGTIDSFMWQLNETKQKMIDQVMSGDLSIDEVEDVSDSANQMAMAKALSSGNPLLLEQAGLTSEVKKLEALQAANINQNHANRTNAAKLAKRIPRMERDSKEITELSKRYTSTAGDSFVMEISGHTFTERKEAGIALIRLADNLFAEKVESKVIGNISGYEITFSKGFIDWNLGLFDNDAVTDAEGRKMYDGIAAYNTESVAALGVVRKLENNAKELKGIPARLSEQVKIAEKKLSILQNESSSEFQFEKELESKRERLDEINRSLESEDISEQITTKPSSQDGLSASKVKKIVNDIINGWKDNPKITVVQSFSDLPTKYIMSIEGSKVQSSPNAFIDDNTNDVYIIADEINSNDDVIRSVFHEVLGHKGLRGLLGNDLDQFLSKVWSAFQGTKEMKEVQSLYRGKLNASNKSDRLKLAEELMARMAEQVNKNTLPQRLQNLWDRIVAFVKSAVRSMGFTPELSKADLTSVILDAANYIREGSKETYQRTKLFQRVRAIGNNSNNISYSVIVPANESGLYKERALPVVNKNEVSEALRSDKTATRILGKYNVIKTGDLIGVRLNINVLKKTGIAVQSVHKNTNKEGYKNNKGFWGGEVLTYQDTVTLKNAYFNVQQTARNKIASGLTSKLPMASVDGEYVDGNNSADGIEVRFNPKDIHLFADINGRPVRYAELVTIQGHRAYVRGKIEYYETHDAPEKVGDSPSSVQFSFMIKGDKKNTVDDRTSFRDRKWYKRSQMWIEENTPFKDGKIKNVSVWSKTVGSMYHLGQKEPTFKKVFDAGQEFLNDVSLMAIEAEKKAGSLFYRMDTVKQAVMQFVSPKKAGIASDEDTAAVAIPIYRGTILDEKIYNDDELKSQFKLNVTQIKLYHQVIAATQKSLDDTTKASMFRSAKIMGIDSQLLHGIRQSTGSANEFLELLYQHTLKPTREALKEEVALLKSNLENAPEEFKAIIKNQLNDKQAEFKAFEVSIASLYKMQAEAKKLKDEGYFPLMRFGKYYVDAYSTDANGKEVREAFLMFENAVDARMAAEELQEEYPDSKVNAGIMSQEQHKLFQELTPETVSLFAKQSGMDQSSAFQEYLKLAVSNRSAMKRLIKRKKTAGFSKDLGRTLASFIMSNARLSSAHYHMGDMVEAIDNIPSHKGDVKDIAVKLRDYLINPVEEFSKIRGYMFFNFLGGSISSALVNLTQIPMATFPYLSQWGTKQASTLLTKWSATNAKLLDSKHEADLNRAEQEGIVSPQEVYNLMATARGQQIPILKGKKAQSFLFMWGSMFSAAEQFNRRVTFNAAYEIARNEGMENAYDFAVKAVDESQFIYNKGNRPSWARGIGAPIFTFKQFMINYLEMLTRLPKKQRALALALIILAAGLEGLPFAEDAEDILDTIMQWAGYNWNTRAKMIQWARDTFGKEAGDMVSNAALRGITSVIPLDIQGRLSFGNIIPATSILKPSETNKGGDAWEALGVTTSVAKNIGYGLSDIFKGNVGKGIYTMSPKAIRDVVKGVDMMSTGKYRDNRGKITGDVKPVDAILKGIGFHPSRVSNIQRSQRSLQQLITLHGIMKQTIADKFARGIAFKEPNEVKEAKEDLKDWNKKNPDFPIAISGQSIKQRVMQFMLPSELRLMNRTPPEIRNKIYKAMK